MNRTFKLALGLVAFLSIATVGMAQESYESTAPEAPGWAHTVGFTGAFGLEEPTRISALDYAAYYGIGAQKKLRVGPGLRGFVYTSEFVWYPTVNTDNVGAADGDRNENQLFVLNPSMSALNLSLNAKYQTNRFVAGFSIDLAGLGFGGDEGGRFYLADTTNGEGILDSRNVAAGTTTAPGVNLMMSQGSLMNELWVGYRIRPAITVRGGVSMFGSEYEVDPAQLPEGVTETRYEHTAMQVFFGLNLQLN